MIEDPIIEELHKFREAWAAQFDYDVHALAAAPRRSQQEKNRHVVNLPPKRVADVSKGQEQVDDSVNDENESRSLSEKFNQAA
jgi:hypothetical protein